MASEPVPGCGLHVLWRGDDCVAIHKPAGWLVHRTGLDAGETRFVVQTLRDQLGRPVYPVHRLDKGTSGVLLMALTSEAARHLSGVFERREVRKRYVAMVRGWLSAEIHVDHALRPDDAPPDAPAQDAVTDFRLIARCSLDVPVDRYPQTRVGLVEASPHTGRRHQIRRHLKHLSHPIIGDATHGKGAHNRWWGERLGAQRLWLHAASLCFADPHAQGQWLSIASPLSSGLLNADWQRLLAEDWRWAQADAKNRLLSGLLTEVDPNQEGCPPQP